MPGDSTLNLTTLPEFFKERVTEAFKEVDVKASAEAEFYLVNLLTDYSKSETAFKFDENGEVKDTPLAIQLLESSMASPGERASMLKRLGDFSLYTSGFFSDSVLGKTVNMDYYIKMGCNAYSALASLIREKTGQSLRELFAELSKNFPSFVDVLSVVANSANLGTDQNLLKVYERFQSTGSPQAQKILTKEGIIPHACQRSKYPH